MKAHSILLTEKADQVLVAERSGTVYRYNTADLNTPVLAETVRVVPASSTLTAFGFLLGGQSLVVGGSDGSLNIFFLLKKEGADTKDGQALQLTRSFDRLPSRAVFFEPAIMGKNFAVADSKGNLFVYHGTSQKLLVQFPSDAKTREYRTILLSPAWTGFWPFRGMAECVSGSSRFLILKPRSGLFSERCGTRATRNPPTPGSPRP